MSQIELFPELEEQELNPMIREHGTGPQSTYCHGCKHLQRREEGAIAFIWCSVRGTEDHRAGWQSCRKYEWI